MLQPLQPMLYEGAAQVLNQAESIRRACEVELASIPNALEDIVLRQGCFGPYLQLGTKNSPSAVQQVPKGTRRSANKTIKPTRTVTMAALKRGKRSFSVALSVACLSHSALLLESVLLS
jgi:topoisomerase IA-like protein